MPIAYHVYANAGAGGPIDYATPIGDTTGTSWTVAGGLGPGTWSFGVRAYDAATGLEEENLDCATTIVIDTGGNDISNRPMPPNGLRAFATAGGGLRVEWHYPPTSGALAPTGFHVYVGIGSPDYSSPTATIGFNTAIQNTFVANLALTGGTTYEVGVRAYNAIGEETNTVVVSVAADATGPGTVDSLTATTIV